MYQPSCRALCLRASFQLAFLRSSSQAGIAMLAPEAEAKHDAPFFSATSRLGVSASRFATGFLVTLVHACADLCKHNDRHFFEEEVGRECGKHVREHVACLHSFRLAPQKPAGNRSLQLAGPLCWELHAQGSSSTMSFSVTHPFHWLHLLDLLTPASPQLTAHTRHRTPSRRSRSRRQRRASVSVSMGSQFV